MHRSAGLVPTECGRLSSASRHFADTPSQRAGRYLIAGEHSPTSIENAWSFAKEILS